MILFHETSQLCDGVNISDKIEQFESIKSEGDMSVEEADRFWENTFSEPDKITEIDITSEIYGRDESDFSFDFDIERFQNLLEKFEYEQWNFFSVEQKQEIIKELVGEIADALDIENIPEIRFYEAEAYDCGAFIPKENIIKVNVNIFDDSYELLNTIAHETRHAFQFERAMKLENYEDLLYACNFDNYIAPIITEEGCINFNEYQDQLIEAEARAFANLFTEGR